MGRHGPLYNIVMRDSDLDCFSEYEIIRFAEDIPDIIRDFRITLRKLINIALNTLVTAIAIARIPNKDIHGPNSIIYLEDDPQVAITHFQH